MMIPMAPKIRILLDFPLRCAPDGNDCCKEQSGRDGEECQLPGLRIKGQEPVGSIEGENEGGDAEAEGCHGRKSIECGLRICFPGV